MIKNKQYQSSTGRLIFLPKYSWSWYIAPITTSSFINSPVIWTPTGNP
jgi:hypothetical protein